MAGARPLAHPSPSLGRAVCMQLGRACVLLRHRLLGRMQTARVQVQDREASEHFR
jgi:hypothetical protein